MFMVGLGIFVAVYIAPCAYRDSLIDSAEARADARLRIGGGQYSPATFSIFAAATPFIDALQISLVSSAVGITLSPRCLAFFMECLIIHKAHSFRLYFTRGTGRCCGRKSSTSVFEIPRVLFHSAPTVQC